MDVQSEEFDMDQSEFIVTAKISVRVLVELLVDAHDGSVEVVLVTRIRTICCMFDVSSKYNIGEYLEHMSATVVA